MDTVIQITECFVMRPLSPSRGHNINNCYCFFVQLPLPVIFIRPRYGAMIVWRLRGKIVRTAMCCVVYDSCAQRYTHICDQFSNLCKLDLHFFVCLVLVRNFICIYVLA